MNTIRRASLILTIVLLTVLGSQAQTPVNIRQVGDVSVGLAGVPVSAPHVALTSQTGNAQFILALPNGMVWNQLSFGHTGTITGLSTLIEVAKGNPTSPVWITVGTSTLTDDSIGFGGNYAQVRITYSGFTGGGTITGDYFGATLLPASPVLQ